MGKEEVLQNVIRVLEHLINNIGETTTEYHWREFAGLVEVVKDSFPEYDLNSYQLSLFE